MLSLFEKYKFEILVLGDSGGPLVSNETLIGLVSWSVGCAGGYPDVYTKVFAQLNWIHQTMNTLDSSS